MDYLDIFSKSNELYNIFYEAFKNSDEENKISLFKLYYSWKHYVDKDILDELKNKLILNRLKEKLMRERPEIIEKYDKYNEEIEKKRKQIQLQEIEQQKLQQNFFGNSNTTESNTNTNGNTNNNYNISNNNVYGINNLNTKSINTNQIQANKNINASLNKPVINYLQVKNINHSTNGNFNLNNQNITQNNINITSNTLNPILLGKANINQSLLSSITTPKEKKKEEANHLFSSASSESSDEESGIKNANQLNLKSSKNIRIPSIVERDLKDKKDIKNIPIKKRKIDEINSDNILDTDNINLNTTTPNKTQLIQINPLNNTLNQFNLNSNTGNNPPSLIPQHNLNINNPNFPLMGQNTNFSGLPRPNIFPFQKMLYPHPQGNPPNIPAGQIGFNFMGQQIPNLQNINHLVAAARGNPYPNINQINPQLNTQGQATNLMFSAGQNLNPNIIQQAQSLIPRADGSMFKNINFPDNVGSVNQLANFMPFQANATFGNLDSIEGQNINLSETGINYMNSFISKSNIQLDEKMPFFSSLAKWFYESILEDNPLNEIKKDNKKINTLYDLLKIKDFSEKESYKDLFKKVQNSLYSDIKNICSICGFRTSQYKRFVEHLDIHFHINYIKKNSRKRDLYRRESCSKNSWITNTDNNLNLPNTNLNLGRNENINLISTLNSVLYYLNDSEIYLNTNKNNTNNVDSEGNENMIFPIQERDLQCIYCKDEFKKKYFIKHHFWFYINVNKLNVDELRMLNHSNINNGSNSNLNLMNNANTEDDEEIVLIHNTCLEEFVNLIILNNKKNLEEMYMKIN